MIWDMRYRRLEAGETILPGDEVEVDHPYGWRPSKCIHQPAPDPAYSSHRVYRRLLRPVVAAQQPHATMMNVAAYADYFVELE